jgi:hypothetical protein
MPHDHAVDDRQTHAGAGKLALAVEPLEHAEQLRRRYRGRRL